MKNENTLFMELNRGSSEKYQITKIENCIRIDCDTKLEICDTYYDKATGEILIAVQRYLAPDKLAYNVEYLFLDENLHIKKVLIEDRGVMPKFLPAPDDSIWVILVSTVGEDGQILLPLLNRTRLTKEIVKKDTPYIELFRWNGNMYALFGPPMGSRTKCGKLVYFQFDKNHLFKTTKNSKLEFCRYPRVLVQDSHCFIQSLEGEDGTVQICSREIDKNGAVLNEWHSELMDEKDTFAPRMVARTSDELICICNDGAKNLYALIFGYDGALKERRFIGELPEVIAGRYIEYVKKLEDGSFLFHVQAGRGFFVVKNFQLTEWIFGTQEQILWNGKNIMEKKNSTFVPLSTPKGNYFISSIINTLKI